MRSTPNGKSKGKGQSKSPSKRAAKPLPVEKQSNKPGSQIQFSANIRGAKSKEAALAEIRLAKEARLARLEAISKDPWDVFLAAVRRVPDRGAALDAAGIDRKELSARLQTDPEFEKVYKRAFDDGLDSMEDEVVRRAMLGVDEPVYQGGLLVGHKTRYSDTLLMFYLEACRKKFKQGDVEARRPLSEEAKNTMRQVFQEAADEAGLFTPPTALPKKRRAKKPMEDE